MPHPFHIDDQPSDSKIDPEARIPYLEGVFST
jgi:hypothetical protein